MNQDCYMPWWKIKPIGEILGVRKSLSAWPKWGTEPLKHGLRGSPTHANLGIASLWAITSHFSCHLFIKSTFETPAALSSAVSTWWLLRASLTCQLETFQPERYHPARWYLLDPNLSAERVFLLSWGLFPFKNLFQYFWSPFPKPWFTKALKYTQSPAHLEVLCWIRALLIFLHLK